MRFFFFSLCQPCKYVHAEPVIIDHSKPLNTHYVMVSNNYNAAFSLFDSGNQRYPRACNFTRVNSSMATIEWPSTNLSTYGRAAAIPLASGA